MSARGDPSSSTASSTPYTLPNTSTAGPMRTTAPGSSLSAEGSVPGSCLAPSKRSVDWSGHGHCRSAPSRKCRPRSLPTGNCGRQCRGPTYLPQLCQQSDRTCGRNVDAALVREDLFYVVQADASRIL